MASTPIQYPVLAPLILLAAGALSACNSSNVATNALTSDTATQPQGQNPPSNPPAEDPGLTGTWRSVCLSEGNLTTYDFTFVFDSVQNESYYPFQHKTTFYQQGSNCQGSATSQNSSVGTAHVGSDSAYVAGATDLDLIIPATASYAAQARYTVFKISNNQLYLGLGGTLVEYNGSTLAKRERAIDTTMFFTRQ